MTMTSGQELSARFVLVRALGHGGCGEVWLAQDRHLGGFVALKILKPEFAARPEVVAALGSEFERVKQLVHPHIVRVDGVHGSGDTVWLAMEYLSGGDLTQFRGRPAHEVLRLAVPIADALSYAHSAGVVHRDVKTANVLLAADGSPRLADFGLALAFDAVPGARSGRGSPYSMSPQQAAGEPAQPADDVYAFGVMLYELLSGYPPFYPEIDADKRAHRPPPPLAARFAVPPELERLLDRCLSKASQERPNMAEVTRELHEIMEAQREAGALPRVQATPVLRPPAAAEQPLRPQWQRSAGTQGPSPGELRREGFRRGLTVAAFVLLLAAAGTVFFVLPQRVGPQQVAVPTPTPAPQAESPAAPIDLQRLAVEKQRADDQLASITPRVAALEQRAAAQWGGQPWTDLQTGLTAAAEQYAARDYAGAAGRHEIAAQQLDALEARAGEVLRETLARGGEALEQGLSAPAAEAFELALKLEPGNATAARGLKRAQTLDEVVALVARAEGLENEGQMADAAEVFERALKLDPDAARASSGLARVRGRQSADAFAASMAQGFTALSAKQFASARKSFESARSLRPQAAEVQQALQQVEQEERTVNIAARLDSARGHEAAERWQQALADYQAILQLDATVAAAQQGVERTTPRAQLNDELQLYVTQPERLFSAPVRETARLTLVRAQTVAAPGPVLTKQIATLEGWLKAATVPVQVAIESDNATQVTIYRVGELGVFDRRSVELLPGRYTVVGTRPGFRDVRREIMVAPGEAIQPVVIRCEDRI